MRMTHVVSPVHRLGRRLRLAAVLSALVAAGCVRDEATAPSAGDGGIELTDYITAYDSTAPFARSGSR